MTFIEYYKQQFKDVKTVYLLAKKHKKWPAFINAAMKRKREKIG